MTRKFPLSINGSNSQCKIQLNGESPLCASSSHIARTKTGLALSLSEVRILSICTKPSLQSKSPHLHHPVFSNEEDSPSTCRRFSAPFCCKEFILPLILLLRGSICLTTGWKFRQFWRTCDKHKEVWSYTSSSCQIIYVIRIITKTREIFQERGTEFQLLPQRNAFSPVSLLSISFHPSSHKK